MEVLAIPIIAAAGLLYATNDNKNKMREGNAQHKIKKAKREAFISSAASGTGVIAGKNSMLNDVPDDNYPKDTTNTSSYDNLYSGNAVTDKYYNASVDKRVLKYNDQFNNPYNTNVHTGVNSQSTIYSLTGEAINTNKFEHSNMVPFFGAKVRGGTADADTHESILDSYSGTGSQKICKEERAPLLLHSLECNIQMVCPILLIFFSHASIRAHKWQM